MTWVQMAKPTTLSFILFPPAVFQSCLTCRKPYFFSIPHTFDFPDAIYKKNVIYICYLLFTFISYALPSVIHARGKMYVDILYAFCMTCQRWWIDIDVYKELAHIQINSLIFSTLTSIWKKTTLKWKRTLNIDLSFTRFVQAHGEKLKKGR